MWHASLPSACIFMTRHDFARGFYTLRLRTLCTFRMGRPIYGSQTGLLKKTDDQRPLLGRKPAQEKNSLPWRKVDQAQLADCPRAVAMTKGRHQRTSYSLQLHRSILEATNCPCAGFTDHLVAMKQVVRNETLPTTRRVSSLHSWSVKGQMSSKHAGEQLFFWWKLAQRPSEHLNRDYKSHTAFSFCT